MNINRVTLQHNKEFIMFIFYLMVLSMCNLQKRFIRIERLKTNSTAIKITRETTNNQQKKYNSVKHIQRQQFSFTKTSIKMSLKIVHSKSERSVLALKTGPFRWVKYGPIFGSNLATLNQGQYSPIS